MMKSGCIHPEILRALALCGHGDQILIADGNYPLDSRSGSAVKVYLGLTSGIPTVTDVLRTLTQEICVEKAEIMMPEEGPEPPIFGEFRDILHMEDLGALGRYEFYDRASAAPVKLAILTGEKRVFANILLTVGVA